MSSLGDSGPEPRPAAMRLAVLLAVVLIGWVVLLLFLSKQRPRPAENVPPELPVAQNAYDIERSRADVPDWEQVTYKVDLSYPSTAVYQFYRQVLENQDWKPRPRDKAPQWQVATRARKTEATLYAAWQSPDQLRLIELTLLTEPDAEPPLMQVMVQRSRAILPDAQPDRR